MSEIEMNGKTIAEDKNETPSTDGGKSLTAQFIREEAQWLLSIAEKDNLQILSNSLRQVILEADSVE